jgi:hypothetical protein
VAHLRRPHCAWVLGEPRVLDPTAHREYCVRGMGCQHNGVRGILSCVLSATPRQEREKESLAAGAPCAVRAAVHARRRSFGAARKYSYFHEVQRMVSDSYCSGSTVCGSIVWV